MFLDRIKPFILIILALALSSCAGLAFSPSHYGKFNFKGSVKTAEGKPVSGAWVKVRGWETLTDAQGQWTQEHILHCGALREHPASHVEFDGVLVVASGFEPAEEGFQVKHPNWFSSCEPEQTLAFSTVLTEAGRPAKTVKTQTNQPTAPEQQKSQPTKGISL